MRAAAASPVAAAAILPKRLLLAPSCCCLARASLAQELQRFRAEALADFCLRLNHFIIGHLS
jgi:hypothetical protein